MARSTFECIVCDFNTDDLEQAWDHYARVGHTMDGCGTPDTFPRRRMSHHASQLNRARCIIRVTAGETRPDSLLTREWLYVEADWQADLLATEPGRQLSEAELLQYLRDNGQIRTTIARYLWEAQMYQRSLINPSRHKFVTLEWLWL